MATCCGDDSVEREYAAETSLHGVGKIAGARHRGVRLIWSALFLGMFGVATWQITERFVAYFQFDTVTNMKVEFRDVLDFPTVTICNFNNFGSLDAWLRIAAMHYPGLEPGQSLAEFTLRAGFDIHTSLKHCLWRGQTCNSDNFTHIFTSFGNCWMFNGDGKMNQTISGVGNGLQVAIDIQQDEYTENAPTGNLDAGIRFIVHSPSEPPKVDTQGISVGPGIHAYASISKIEFTNEIPPWGSFLSFLQGHVSLGHLTLKKAPKAFTNEIPPWGQCDPGRALQYYSGYTKTGCLLECRADHVADECGCRTVSMPGTLDYCQPADVTGCVKTTIGFRTEAVLTTHGCPTFAHVSARRQHAEAPELKTGKRSCNCPTPCSATAYPATMSYGGWPSSSTMDYFTDLLNITEQEIKDNIVLLDVYYQQLNLQTVQQRRAISTNALLGDLGGQLGLFLGASVITIIEFLEFLVKKGTSCCFRHKNRVKT
ncbi:Acid-sensing ion channel 2 [Branchiostoma belcheri]|nr:Acid-sensing ion channel 2 [Branchiostoma belcheri]